MELNAGDERMMTLLYLTRRSCDEIAVAFVTYVLRVKHKTDWNTWTNDPSRRDNLIEKDFKHFKGRIPELSECDTTLLTRLLSDQLAKVNQQGLKIIKIVLKILDSVA